MYMQIIITMHSDVMYTSHAQVFANSSVNDTVIYNITDGVSSDSSKKATVTEVLGVGLTCQ